jgi:hypothetical protein
MAQRTHAGDPQQLQTSVTHCFFQFSSTTLTDCLYQHLYTNTSYLMLAGFGGKGSNM